MPKLTKTHIDRTIHDLFLRQYDLPEEEDETGHERDERMRAIANKPTVTYTPHRGQLRIMFHSLGVWFRLPTLNRFAAELGIPQNSIAVVCWAEGEVEIEVCHRRLEWLI